MRRTALSVSRVYWLVQLGTYMYNWLQRFISEVTRVRRGTLLSVHYESVIWLPVTLLQRHCHSHALHTEMLCVVHCVGFTAAISTACLSCICHVRFYSPSLPWLPYATVAVIVILFGSNLGFSRILDSLLIMLWRCSRARIELCRKRADLDEIWSTLSTLFGASNGRFWTRSDLRSSESWRARRHFVFVRWIMHNFTDFLSAKFDEIW